MKTLITLTCMLLVFAACKTESETQETPIESPSFSCSPAVEPVVVDNHKIVSAPITVPATAEISRKRM